MNYADDVVATFREEQLAAILFAAIEAGFREGSKA